MLPVLLLLLIAGAVLWGRRFVAASGRHRAERETTLAALASHRPGVDREPVRPPDVTTGEPVTASDDRG